MTTLLDIVRAVDSAPTPPDHTAACAADPLLCPLCGGDGKPTVADIYIATTLGDQEPAACRRCRGTGRRNCEKCGVRPWTRSSAKFQWFLCELCDRDARGGEPCAVCGGQQATPELQDGAGAAFTVGLLHYPCGQLFCSEQCAVDPRHTCDIDRRLDEDSEA